MDTNIDALKNLYVALGGNIEDVENINTTPDMINAIATVATNLKGKGGKTQTIPEDRLLPVCTAEDRDKVLTVDTNGKWQPMAWGGR